MTEAERAALFRRQAQAREDEALRRWTALRGDSQAYRELCAATEALIEDPGWDPIERVLPSERVEVVVSEE